MKHAVIFDKNYNVRAFLHSKKDVDSFMTHRNEENYRIEEIKDKDFQKLDEKVRLEIKSKEASPLFTEIIDGAIVHRDMMLTPDEEEWMFEGFDQFMIDLDFIISRWAEDVIPNLKLSKQEEEIVMTFLALVYQYTQYPGGSDEDLEHVDITDLFHMEKFAADTIRQLG